MSNDDRADTQDLAAPLAVPNEAVPGMAAAVASVPPRQRRSYLWVAIIAVVVVIIGVGIGLFFATNQSAQNDWKDNLTGKNTLGVMTIPALGSGQFPILAGTDYDTLRQGVGWYPSTTEIGGVGNCVIAGYRLGWGQPFYHLDQLAVGDQITITTGDTTLTYTVVTGPTTVSSTDSSVLDPVPGGAGQTPTRALLTLTTGGSLLPSNTSLVVVAQLTP